MGKNKESKSNRPKFIGIGVVAAISAIIAAVAATGGANLDTTLDTTNASPVLGSESAPITLVEFGDYQCPYCQKWNLNIKPSIQKDYIDTGKVKLVYVDLPIVGDDSIKAHASSYCADEQGLYWKYHDFLYQSQGHENDGWASPESLKMLASTMPGLDVDKFSECLDSGKYENRVQENKNIAIKSGARSTPTFVVIGPNNVQTSISGAQPYSVFESVFAEKMP